MIPIPNVSDVIHYCLDNAGTWINAFLPYTGLIIGIAAVGLIGHFIVNWIDEKLDWDAEKEDLLYERDSFRHLFGAKTGDSMFERWRLFDELSPSARKFITPRDMLAGQSMSSFLAEDVYRAPSIQPWDRINPLGEHLDPNDFKRRSVPQKIYDWVHRNDDFKARLALPESERGYGYMKDLSEDAHIVSKEENENYIERFARNEPMG